jgi:hypothetical protein
LGFLSAISEDFGDGKSREWCRVADWEKACRNMVLSGPVERASREKGWEKARWE